jgi:hypothetical protein
LALEVNIVDGARERERSHEAAGERREEIAVAPFFGGGVAESAERRRHAVGGDASTASTGVLLGVEVEVEVEVEVAVE